MVACSSQINTLPHHHGDAARCPRVDYQLMIARNPLMPIGAVVMHAPARGKVEQKRPGKNFARPRSDTHQLSVAETMGFAKRATHRA
jgi:hypothetical protein